MAMIKGQPSDAGAGGAGWVYVTDAATQGAGTITSRVWQDPPGNTVLQSFVASSGALRLSVRASYPTVDVGGVPAVLSRDVSGGYYSGQVDITVAASGDIVTRVYTADNNAGDGDTVSVTINLPPVILSLSFTGPYPGAQTELKAGDTFQITGTTDSPIDQVLIADHEAFQSASIAASGTAFTVTGTIADRGVAAVLRPARVQVRDAVTGAYSDARDTNQLGGTVNGTDLVLCNNRYPTVTFGAVTYPGGQQALKATETATVVNGVTDYDSILYDSPVSELLVTNATTLESPKTVQRIAGGYNVTTDNLRITATRAANDATTVDTAQVAIANDAVAVTVLTPASRLRSGGNDGTTAQNHTITLSGNQRLLNAPTLNAGASGTFLGSWSGSGSTWTRTLQVHDNDTKGTFAWTGLVATNLAGIVTGTISIGGNYVLGGFVPRTLTFPVFSQTTGMNVAVTDYSKVQAGIFTATNQPAQRNPVQNDTSDLADTYTVLSPLNTNPQIVFWNDLTQANANSSGTAAITAVEELV